LWGETGFIRGDEDTGYITGHVETNFRGFSMAIEVVGTRSLENHFF
jgi:hypothetical protein